MELFRINKTIGQLESTVYDWKNKLEKGINFFEQQSKIPPPPPPPSIKKKKIKKKKKTKIII